MFSLKDFLKSTPIPGFENLTVSRIIFDVLVLILIYVIARLTIWFIKKVVRRGLKSTDEGKKFAITQISKYFIYAIAIGFMLDKLHIGTVIFTSFAGLFVGLGFGIQQTFNDLASGLILLFEGSVKVGDYINFEGSINKITSIGVRHSTLQTRDGTEILVPNSKLIVENVINYSIHHIANRFCVKVGVAYGSNVQLVKQKLLEAVYEHKDTILYTSKLNELGKKLGIEDPLVYFKDFGDNSLNFEVYFWTENVWDVEIMKSDIRFTIDKLFRENDITIAFPQRDVHIKVEEKEIKKIKKFTE